MNLRDPILLLDFQTTGMRPGSGRVLEIGWCKFSSDVEPPVVESRLIALNEGEELPERIQEITGIREEDLRSARAENEVWAEVLAAAAGSRVRAVAHYAQFERAFYDGARERLGLNLEIDWVCSQRIGKKLFPELPSQNLRALAGFFGSQMHELKRAAEHVRATAEVWRACLRRLNELDIRDWDQLDSWLKVKAKPAPRYQYRIEKLQRLALPDRPGIYRMLAQDGKILYVGKATSLRSRVNSYFRGQKGRDRRKLEMLAQVYDLKVTECETPMEAALLETDEIKKWNPPYNVVLKEGRRGLIFYDRHFTDESEQQSAEHPHGPFRPMNILESLRLLVPGPVSGDGASGNGTWHQIFYQEIDSVVLEGGLDIFCERWGLTRERLAALGMRGLLALAMHRLRAFRREHGEDLETVFARQKAERQTEDALTSEDVAGKFERLFLRSAAALRRARALTKVLNCQVVIKSKQGARRLEFRNGRMIEPATEAPPRERFPWAGSGIAEYDRMTILLGESERRGYEIVTS